MENVIDYKRLYELSLIEKKKILTDNHKKQEKINKLRQELKSFKKKERNKNYYQKNKKFYKERNKNYYQKNKKQIKEYSKRAYEKKKAKKFTL